MAFYQYLAKAAVNKYVYLDKEHGCFYRVSVSKWRDGSRAFRIYGETMVEAIYRDQGYENIPDALEAAEEHIIDVLQGWGK